MRLLARKDLRLAEIALEVGVRAKATSPRCSGNISGRPRRVSPACAEARARIALCRAAPGLGRPVSRDLARGGDYLVRSWAST